MARKILRSFSFGKPATTASIGFPAPSFSFGTSFSSPTPVSSASTSTSFPAWPAASGQGFGATASQGFGAPVAPPAFGSATTTSFSTGTPNFSTTSPAKAFLYRRANRSLCHQPARASINPPVPATSSSPWVVVWYRRRLQHQLAPCRSVYWTCHSRDATQTKMISTLISIYNMTYV